MCSSDLFIDWLDTRPHPSEDSPTGVTLKRFELGHPESAELQRIFRALDIDIPVVARAVPTFTAILDSPKGEVVLRT